MIDELSKFSSDRPDVRREIYIAHAVRRQFRDDLISIDSQGVPWIYARLGVHGFAVTWLGAGWVFDPFASQQRAEKLELCRREIAAADHDRHRLELRRVVERLRLGPLGERLLWSIHRLVLETRSSVIRVSDLALGQAAWGLDRGLWPCHWRTELIDILTSLSWLISRTGRTTQRRHLARYGVDLWEIARQCGR